MNYELFLLPLHPLFRHSRRDGRVVDYNGLENRRAERHRGFESLSLRGFPKFGTSKTLILNGLAFFHA